MKEAPVPTCSISEVCRNLYDRQQYAEVPAQEREEVGFLAIESLECPLVQSCRRRNVNCPINEDYLNFVLNKKPIFRHFEILEDGTLVEDDYPDFQKPLKGVLFKVEDK
jgi:hypothetical protein